MITGLPAGQAPLNDTYHPSTKVDAQSDTPIPAVSTPDIDTIVQISPQGQRLAQLDAVVATLNNPKEWKQQKKPKTLLDYIEESEVRGRGPRAEEAERRRQQLGNWMPMIAVGDETGMSINVLAKNLAAAAVSDATDAGGAALPLLTVYVTGGKQGEGLVKTTLKKDTTADDKKSGYLLTLQRLLSVSDPNLRNALYGSQDKVSTAGDASQGKDLKTQLLLAMSDVVAGTGFIKRQLEMLHVAIRRHHCHCNCVGVVHFNTAQINARFLDHNGNPDLSKMLGAVFAEQIEDESAG